MKYYYARIFGMTKSYKMFVLLLLMIGLLTGCVNKSKINNCTVPIIKSVQLFDENLKPIKSDSGWYTVKPTTIVRVKFEGKASSVFFYLTPTGSETELEQKCIGSVDTEIDKDYVDLKWNPQNGYIGYLWVLVYDGDVARKSNEGDIKIISE